jgi:hypothetical protein
MKQSMRSIEKMSRAILKLDFEKAYDKAKWEFLQQTLRMKVRNQVVSFLV